MRVRQNLPCDVTDVVNLQALWNRKRFFLSIRTSNLKDTFSRGLYVQVLRYIFEPLTGSHLEFKDGPVVTAESGLASLCAYLGDVDKYSRDPAIFPLEAADLSGLPPALVIVSDRDILGDDGVLYAERLQEAGCACCYPIELHDYNSHSTLLGLCKQFWQLAAHNRLHESPSVYFVTLNHTFCRGSSVSSR